MKRVVVLVGLPVLLACCALLNITDTSAFATDTSVPNNESENTSVGELGDILSSSSTTEVK